MRSEPYLPTRVGLDALGELDRVDWSQLQHAYGQGVVGSELYGDVRRSLALLRDDPTSAINHGLYSNVCHQGTVYEASAYAAPFIAAVAAGDVPSALRSMLVRLFGDIAIGGSFVAPGGSWAGSFGDGVDELVTDTVNRCDGRLGEIERADRGLLPLIAAIRHVIAAPSDESRQAALDLIDPAE